MRDDFRSSYGIKLVVGYAITGAFVTVVGVATGSVEATIYLFRYIDWVGFLASAGFHLVLLGILYLVFPRYASQNPGRRRLFNILQNHVGLLWIAYPVVWVVIRSCVTLYRRTVTVFWFHGLFPPDFGVVPKIITHDCISTAGIGAVSVLGTGMTIAYFDAVAKTPYVYFVWRERAAFSGQDHATGAREQTGAPTTTDTT